MIKEFNVAKVLISQELELREAFEISIGPELSRIIKEAYSCARKWRHEFITGKHLLFVLLHNESAVKVFLACEVDIDNMRQKLATHIKENTLPVIGTSEVDPRDSLDFLRVINNTKVNAHHTGKLAYYGKVKAKGVDTLLEILYVGDPLTIHYLDLWGVTRQKVTDFMRTHGVKKASRPRSPSPVKA